MPLLVQAPRFTTGTPDLLHSDNQLTFSLPLINSGTNDANNIQITNITLGSASRLVPSSPPVFIGNLGVNSAAPVNARFSSSGLAVGGQYLISVLGTYQLGGTTFSFRAHQYITVPPQVAAPVTFLKARAAVAVGSGSWTYTLFNDEPAGSQQFIHTFALEVVSPVLVTGMPAGWQVLTDNNSYVLWYPGGEVLPNPLDIAPGASLGGFVIQSAKGSSESVGYSIGAWNHETNEAGLTALSAILVPTRF